jgi:hypothetical protein
MKKIIMLLVLLISFMGLTSAQENQQKSGINLYTLFVNIVNEQFRFPLIGFVNIAAGSHNLPQIGFFNWNQNDFSSLQLSFVNTVGGDMVGLQTGFVNTVVGNMSGVQAGFINTTVKSFKGSQVGFINTSAGEQLGGLQMGFINTSVNEINGGQISFINITKQLNGLQLGFINYNDSIESGIPIGFLSIVRNGGYKAIELGVSEISPFNVSFKIGIKQLYTSFIVSYNPFRDNIRDQIIWGVGLGSIIPIGKIFFLNPEITSHKAINENFQNYLSVIPYFRYTIIPNLSIVIGPSVTWVYGEKDIEDPFYSIKNYSINDNNKLYLGARMALRFHW